MKSGSETSKRYFLRDASGGESDMFEAPDDATAIAMAREKVGEWVDPHQLEETVWVREALFAVEEGEEDGERMERMVARLRRTIHPAPPRCKRPEWTDEEAAEALGAPDYAEEGGHAWAAPYRLLGGLRENPGVWGHGGGVIITEVCLRCGTERTVDTWAQDPDTGEEGLRSIAYKAYSYSEAIREAVTEAARRPR